MAQRIVFLCDVHARNDEDVAGATWEVTLTGPDRRSTTWEVDLCEDDSKTLRDLGIMLDAVGRVTQGRRTKAPTAARKAASEAGQAHVAPEGHPCPVEGCELVSRSANALATHVRSAHGTTLAELNGEPTPYSCPECDRRFTHPQGLGAHRRSVHGVVSGQASA